MATKQIKPPRKMTNPFDPKKNPAEHFFWERAAWSYDPKIETPARGREDCATNLARAERDAKARGMTFDWSEDDQTQESFRKLRRGEEAYSLWCCLARLDGIAGASLGAIDFGPDGYSSRADYARVVEAELAQEALSRSDVEPSGRFAGEPTPENNYHDTGIAPSPFTVYNVDADDEGCVRLHVNTNVPDSEVARERLAKLIESMT